MITRVLVEPGTWVAAGQVLATVDRSVQTETAASLAASVTVARSDFGAYRPVLRRILETPELDLQLISAGMHLAPEFGNTIREIEDEGFQVADRVDMLAGSETPAAIAQSCSTTAAPATPRRSAGGSRCPGSRTTPALSWTMPEWSRRT